MDQPLVPVDGGRNAVQHRHVNQLREIQDLPDDIAKVREHRNEIAVRHGLPPIGAVMVNQHGIEWLVDGHLFVSTLATIARGTAPEANDPRDLYPVVLPQNLSQNLTDFIAETDRCTSKAIMPLDTMPHWPPREAHPHGYSVDGLTSPDRIVLLLDAAHIHETILAHEIGHLWIDLVEDCEDYRMLKDLSDTGKVFQWTHLQSFVLDCKVNEVLRERGFDLNVIEADLDESLATFSAAILSGYRPPTARESVFVASALATAMLGYEMGAQGALQSVELAAMVFQRDLPDVYQLACQMATSVRRHGYSDRASIRRAIDECALLSFAFLGEPFDLDRELIEERPTEAYHDKYPEVFPGLPVRAKLEIGKAMAKLKIPAGSECRLSYTPGGSVQVQFCRLSGDWTTPVMLHHAPRLPHDATSSGRQRPMQKRNTPVQKPTQPTPVRIGPPPGVPTVAAPSSFATPQPLLSDIYLPGGSPMRRCYSPGLARFLSQVRLQEQLGRMNPYIYAMNNPATHTAYTTGLGLEASDAFDSATPGLQLTVEDPLPMGLCPDQTKKPPKPKPKRQCQNGKLTKCTLVVGQSATFCNPGGDDGTLNDCQGCKSVSGCIKITDPTYTFTIYIKNYHCTYSWYLSDSPGERPRCVELAVMRASAFVALARTARRVL